MAKNPNWTEEEIENLKKYYLNEDKEFLLNILPKRNYQSIQIKASRLGLHRMNYFSEQDLKFIRDNYMIKRSGEISKKLNRSNRTIENKAREIGLLKQFKWSSDEENLLIENIDKFDVNYIASHVLKNRSISSIYHKIQDLNLQKFKIIYKNNVNNDFLLEKLKEKYIEIGRTPSSKELFSLGLPSSVVYIDRFGSYGNACRLIGIPISKGFVLRTEYYSKSNELCLSMAELKITNFLIDNNIKYTKEFPYKNIFNPPVKTKMTCDWFLYDGTVVEYFGMSRNDKYKIRMNKKIELCKKYKVNLMDLYEKDLNNLEKIFNHYI